MKQFLFSVNQISLSDEIHMYITSPDEIDYNMYQMKQVEFGPDKMKYGEMLHYLMILITRFDKVST